MRKPLLVLGLASWLLLAVGCDKLKGLTGGEADAGEDAAIEASAKTADTTPVPVAEPPAKNAADIARFPAETKLGNEPAKILALSAAARTVPKAGAVVATLKSGTDVARVAEHQDAILIAFADPKDAAATLEGWVTKEAFVAAAAVVASDGGALSDAGVKDAGITDAAVDAAPASDAGKPALACAAGQEAVSGFGKDPVCKKKCTADKDCKGAAAGSCAVAAGVTGKVARVCTSE